MTYAMLSLAFLLVALVVFVAATLAPGRDRFRPLLLPGLLAGLALLVLTAVFDNLMIALGIMQYSDDAISGLRVGLAPLEDFAYPLAAVILLPSLWVLFEAPSRRGDPDER